MKIERNCGYDIEGGTMSAPTTSPHSRSKGRSPMRLRTQRGRRIHSDAVRKHHVLADVSRKGLKEIVALAFAVLGASAGAGAGGRREDEDKGPGEEAEVFFLMENRS